MKRDDKTYTILKWLALVCFPACGVLYKTVSAIWGLPYGDAVCETFTAASLFVGALIGVSTAEYHRTKGVE